jgi:hypothetical protein
VLLHLGAVLPLPSGEGFGVGSTVAYLSLTVLVDTVVVRCAARVNFWRVPYASSGEQASERAELPSRCVSHQVRQRQSWRYPRWVPPLSCFKPLQAWMTSQGLSFVERGDVLYRVEIPCGQCVGCRARRRSDWALRIMHEARYWPSSCFLTLTYAPEHLPPDGGLRHRDFQLFAKRLRKRFSIGYYMCGEYGDETRRPHYHAALFGHSFSSDRVPRGKSGSGNLFYSSAELSRYWILGNSTVQDLTPQSAGYVAGYVMKRATGAKLAAFGQADADGVLTELRPEYGAMSKGIGARWVAEFGRDVYPHDFVVSDGVKRRPPRYYDRYLKRSNPDEFDDVAAARVSRALAAFADNTDERRAVREEVFKARQLAFKRINL